MRLLVAILAVMALVGSAMAWDINENLQYTFTKTGFEQGGAATDTPYIVGEFTGATSGAYVKEPGTLSGYGADNVWMQVDNKLVAVTLDRANDQNNPEYSAQGNNFYTKLTQGGSASLSMSAKDTIATTPEITGTATASQNLWVGGEFAEAASTFDSRAIVGFSDIAANNADAPETNGHFVVTDTKEASASIDASVHGAGLFNSANMGLSVESDIEQNYVGSGWAEPTYSGGITMWANFDGACDPHCANPIMTSVSGTAGTSMFPANGVELTTNSPFTSTSIGDDDYWGTNFATDPNLQGV